MPYLTVATIGQPTTSNQHSSAQVMQRVVGDKWIDLSFNLADEGVSWITAIAFADKHLVISSDRGIYCLARNEKEWFQPTWTSGHSYHGTYVTFHSYGGKFYTVGQQLSRRTTVLGPTELQVGGVFPTICSLITTHNGGPEIVYSNSGNDAFASYSIPNLVRTGYDTPGGSCGYDLYEYSGVIYTANDYGFAYRSTNGGRSFGAPWEDIDGVNVYDRNLWSLWEVGGQLYSGTCVQNNFLGLTIPITPGTCQIRRFNGTSWISSPAVVTQNTFSFGQGFLRGLQDPANKSIAYVATGIGSYDAYGGRVPNESKVYSFDGTTLTDISPPLATSLSGLSARFASEQNISGVVSVVVDSTAGWPDQGVIHMSTATFTTEAAYVPGRSFLPWNYSYSGRTPTSFTGVAGGTSPPQWQFRAGAEIRWASDVRFGLGVQAMCFAPNFGRGKTKPGQSSRRLLVSKQTGFSVKADRPVAMTSARALMGVTTLTVGTPGGQYMSNGNWLQVESTAGAPSSGIIEVGNQIGTYSSLLPASGSLFPRFVNVQGISGLIAAGTTVRSRSR